MTFKDYTITFYCSSSSWGGLEMNILQRCYWMKQRGWDVVFAYAQNDRFAAETESRQLPNFCTKRNSKYFAIRSAWRLYRKLKKTNCRYLYITDARDMSLAVWTRFFYRKRIKVVYAQAMQLGIKKKDLIHTWRFNNLDAWVATLPYMLEQVKNKTNISPEKLFCIRLGTDSSRFEYAPEQKEARELLGLPTDGLLAGVIGRFDKQKGQLEAVLALNRLDSSMLKLVLMGEKTAGEADSYYETVQQAIRENELNDRVFILPFNPKVELFFSAIDIFILPSYSETYGMVTVEAMMCGKKILGTDAGGTIELLENGKWGTLFQPENVNSLVSNLGRAVSQITPGYVDSELATFARRKYSWQSEIDLLEDLLENLFQNS